MVARVQDKEFWDKVAEELKPTVKRALKETFKEIDKKENEDNNTKVN